MGGNLKAGYFYLKIKIFQKLFANETTNVILSSCWCQNLPPLVDRQEAYFAVLAENFYLLHGARPKNGIVKWTAKAAEPLAEWGRDL